MSAITGIRILNFFLNEIDREASRQQQLQYERQIQKQNERDWRLFQSAWNDCFNHSDLDRCDLALTFPNLGSQDRTHLLQQLERIIAAAAENEARAERAARIRQQVLEAAEERRVKDEADERERQRLRETEEQRAEAERIRLANEAEAKKLAAQRTFQNDLDGCRSYKAASCDRAQSSPFMTPEDNANIQNWRHTAEAYATARDGCRAGTLSSCDTALASPAASGWERTEMTLWRTDAARVPQATAVVPASSSGEIGNSALVTGSINRISQPAPMTPITSVVAALVVLTGAFLALRNRPLSPQPESNTEPDSSGVKKRSETWLASFRRMLPEPSVAAGPATPEPAKSQTETPQPAKAAEQRLATKAEAPEQRAIDTPAALRALRLAQSYLEETDGGNFSDPDSARTLRTTLALASRQLDIAFRADPNAKLESEVGETISQAHLRSRVLCQEALTWEMENLTKATAIAERATIADPDSASAFHVLGVLHYENRNRGDAIAALTKASELDPGNIEIFKILDRAQNMGAGEVATFKATRAGIRVANAGIGVYNTGVTVWNVFATVYNVLTWPMRTAFKIIGFICGVRF